MRCFEDDDITHVEGRVDPLRDAEIIETELILADLESVEKRIPNLEKKAKQSKEAQEELAILKDALVVLSDGRSARSILSKYNESDLKKLQLLTTKPILYVSNVSEDEVLTGNSLSKKVLKWLRVGS